jgi:hypothetical protein
VASTSTTRTASFVFAFICSSLTTSGLSISQPANVPGGIATLSPSAGSASGGVIVTLRGSDVINVTWRDMNTLTFLTPAVSPGLQRLAVKS